MATQQQQQQQPFNIFMGYDSHEDIAFQVASYSLKKRASIPVEIHPLKIVDFKAKGIYTRPLDPKQSTEFTYLRFFVPYLMNYKGWAMFVDDDFLFLGDIAKLVSLIDDKYAVMCVHHDYNPTDKFKLAGKEQQAYPRKNWSSVILYNCGHPANAALNLELINRETGSYLHRFQWLSDDLIGEIPYTWNFLVGWHKKLPDGEYPNAIHYTEGGPWFPDHRKANVDYGEEWLTEMREYEKTLPKQRLLCPYELFTQAGNPSLSGYPNSGEKWSWENQ